MGKGKKKSEKKSTPTGVSISSLFKTRATKVPLKHQGQSEGSREGGVNWKQLSYLVGLIAVLVIATYLISVFGNAIFNDYYTLRAIQKQAGSPGWAEQFFANPFSSQWLEASYVWDYQLAGPNLAWNHIVNIFLHFMTCIYLFALVFRLSFRFRNEHRASVNPYFIATASAAVLACHPLAVEGVAYISGRAGPLCACNYFLSLNLFLSAYLARNASDRFWGFLFALASGLMAMSVLSAAVTLPAAMLCVAILVKRPQTSWFDWAVDRPIIHASLLILVGALPYLFLYFSPTFTGNGFGLSVLEPTVYWATQMKAIPYYYLRCFLLPVGLTVDPPVPVSSAFTDPWAAFGVVILLLAFVSTYLLRKKPILCLGLILFVLGFFPSVLLVQPELVSDRRFLLSLAGLSILLGWVLARYAVFSMKRSIITGSILIVLLSGLSIWHSLSFSTDTALWTAAVRVNEDSPRAHAMLALTQIMTGKIDDALIQAKTAISMGQNSVWAFIASGRAMMIRKEYSGSQEAFEHALKLAEKQKLRNEIVAICEGGLAGSSYGAGDYSRAVTVGTRALSLDPYKADIRIIVGRALIKMGDYKSGIMELRQGLGQNPNNREAWIDLSVAAIKLGAGDLAYDAAKRGVIPGSSIPARLILAQSCIMTRHYDEGKKALEDILAEDKSNKEAQALMALVEGMTDKSNDQAKTSVERIP